MSVRNSLWMSGGIVFLVLALNLVSAQNDLELPTQSDLESIEEIRELLRNVQLIFETKVASKVRQGIPPEDDETDDGQAVEPNSCSCSGFKCSCCTYINVPAVHLKGDACLSVTYLPRNYGILVALTFGSTTIFSREVSARNPPPICAGIPFLKIGCKVCIQFYNLDVSSRAFSGCSRMQIKVFFGTVFQQNLGCFHINYVDAIQQAGEAEFPYQGAPVALPEGPETLYVGEVQMLEMKHDEYKKN